MNQLSPIPSTPYQYLEFFTLPPLSIEGIVPPIPVSHTLVVTGPNLVSTVNGTVASVPIANIVPATTNTLVYDALGKTITSTVNGVAQTISVAPLDDEGVTLEFNAGNMLLKNAAGTVLSTTPVPDRDQQTLTLGGTPAAPTIQIQGQNTITLPTRTVSNTWTAATRTLVTTVDGVASAGVVISDAQTLTLTGSTLSISGGNSVTLPATTVSNTVTGVGAARTISTTVNGVTGAAVAIPDTESQTLTLTGSTLSISGGNSVTLPATTVSNTVTGVGAARTLVTTVNGVASTAVAIPDTEAQSLTLTGSTLSISGGNSVTLPATTVSNTVTGVGAARTLVTTVNGVASTAVAIPDTEAQTLTLTGNSLAISGGNAVTLPAPPATTNTLTFVAATRVITSTVDGVAASITIPADLDAQTLSLTGSTLAISGGNSVTLPAAPATTNTMTFTAATRVITSTVNGVSATVTIPADLDAQTLSLTGSTLAISGGNSVTLPAAPATTNTLAITKAGGVVSTVNGTAATVSVATGTIVETLGFNAAGNLVFAAGVAATNTIAVTKAGGLVSTVNGTAATVAIPTGTIVETLGFNAAGNIVYGTPSAAINSVVIGFINGTRTLQMSVNGVLSNTTTIPDSDSQTLTLTGSTLAISGGNSVTLPSTPATTNAKSWTKANGLKDAVNGVAADIAIPTGTLADVLGYDASGAVINQAVVKLKMIKELFTTQAASYTTLAPVLTTGAFIDTYAVETLIEVTATGATITLTSPSAAISAEMVGVEIDVKLTGNWVGTCTVAAAATIDGAANTVINKTAANQPSRSFRWTGTKFLIV